MQRTAQQVEVAYEVEDLVAREFVGETQSSIHDLVIVDEDCVVEAGATAEAELVELAELADEAEGARGRDFTHVGVARGQLEMQLLHADRFGLVERVVDDQMRGRLNFYELAALAFLTNRDRALDFNRLNDRVLLGEPHFAQL